MIGYFVYFAVLVIVITAFWILLRREGKNEIRLIIALILILCGLVLVDHTKPFGPEFNTLLVTSLFLPLIAYVIDVLRVKRDFWKRVDETSYDYRKRMVEQESDLIGSLIGELTTHAAAFTANDWPDPQGLSEKGWKGSQKVGLVSDIHTNWLAKYYHYVPRYNRIVRVIRRSTKTADSFKDIKDSFAKVKQAYLETETTLYHTLVYDLGLLQQTYLARPAVKFPIHMSVLLKEKLRKLGIIKKGEEIGDHIYSDTNAKKFTLSIGKSFNVSYAHLEINMKLVLKAIEDFSKQKRLSVGNESN